MAIRGDRRFSSVEAALAFYYRAEEILSSKSSLRLDPEQIRHRSNRGDREDLLMDFLSIAAAMKSLNALQTWLLRELYRPHKASELSRIVTKVCSAGRSRFPRVRWTLQGIGRLRHGTLRQITPELRRRGLVYDSSRTNIDNDARTLHPFAGAANGNNQHANRQPKKSQRTVSTGGSPRWKPHQRIEVIFQTTPSPD